MPTLEKEAEMERVIENVKPNEVPRRFQALGVPQEIMIKKIIIITDEAEEVKPKKKMGKWAQFAKEEPAHLTGVGDYVMECSREIRDNFAFKSELTD